MIRVNYLICLLASLSLYSFCLAQSVEYVQAEDARADIDALHRAFMEGHPENYDPTTPAKGVWPDRKIAFALEQDSISSREYHRLLRRAISNIGCIHTHLVPPPFQRDTSHKYFPEPIKLWKGRLFRLTENDSCEQVTSINGVRAVDLIDDILHYRASDEGRHDLMHTLFNDQSQGFLSSYFDYPKGYHVVGDLTGPHKFDAIDSIQVVTPPSIPADTIFVGDSFRLMRIGGQALLDIDHFSKNDRKQFGRAIAAFDTLGVQGLVIDLRGNGGGHLKSGARLVSHLIDTTATYTVMRPSYMSTEYLDKGGQRSVSASKWMRDVFGFHRAKRNEFGKVFTYRTRPAKEHYQGRIRVLTDGYTGSTSTVVLAWLLEHGCVEHYGEMPGGGLVSNNGGSFPTFVLPGTGHEVKMTVYRLDFGTPRLVDHRPDTSAPFADSPLYLFDPAEPWYRYLFGLQLGEE